MPKGNKTANRDLAAVALAAGKTVAEAATAAKVSERTVTNWKQDPQFAASVSELRSQMVSRAAGRLADSMEVAALVLKSLLLSTDEHVKHKAATKLIDFGIKVTELFELQKRVNELERLFAERLPPK